MRDSYVVLKDSRRFISSHTAMLSVDNSAMSSSRSAVLECETERGKRHVYKGENSFQSEKSFGALDFDTCMQMLVPE